MKTNNRCQCIKNESQLPISVPLVGGNVLTLPPGGSINNVEIECGAGLPDGVTVVRSLNEEGGSVDRRRRLNG